MADPTPPKDIASTIATGLGVGAPASTSAKSGAYDLFKELILIPIDKSLFKTVPEIGHLAPIILTVGSLFFAAISLNYPLFMFAFSSVEAALFFKLIQSLAGFIEIPSISRAEETSAACTSYFQTVSASRFRFLISQGFKGTIPNYPIYFISFAATYCIEGLRYFNNECSELGPQYSNRIYLAIASAAMLIVLYTIYLLVYHCDGFLKLMISCLLGALVGYLICFQNASVFGKTSVDLLFIPSIVKRNNLDFVCVSSAPTVIVKEPVVVKAATKAAPAPAATKATS